MKNCPNCRGKGTAKTGRVCPACEGAKTVSEKRFKELQDALKQIYSINRNRESSWSIV